MIITIYKIEDKLKKNYLYNNLYFIDLNFIKNNTLSFIKLKLKVNFKKK